MTVTAVVKKKKYLSDLYIDGELAFTLDSRVLIDEGIKKGVTIADEQLHNLVVMSEQRRAKEKALYLLGFHDHSKKELFNKLKRTNSEEASEYAADKMVELGFVDDERYARRYAEQLAEVKHMSIRGIRQKLYEKGFERELIDEVTSELELDPQDNIRALVERKYERYLKDEKGIKKTVSALQRMGYCWSDINAVIEEYTEEEY
ncbi:MULTISPECIES: regulatory protein RecX [unclassified Ruminococcus]|uniref:regulatory protein RecX n=1 Tax=unclassified Ruminococcus TaxID=2608920 RepID=UPI00210B4DFC|nr:MULTISPECIES: regulatory protein RecX [unclassified Ruminococcus]MCQ4021984.1 regulatory protein RecX [Ruminococcus sp. zg-924]MCQ4114520.1 regulatory protein RecX [Ruminococcus sp. zg-921]